MIHTKPKSESKFRSDLVRRLTDADAVAVPIESRATARGVADLLVIAGGAAFVELKIYHNLHHAALRPSQRAFARRLARNGALYLTASQHEAHGSLAYCLRDPLSEGSDGIWTTTVEALAKTIIQLTKHREVA